MKKAMLVVAVGLAVLTGCTDAGMAKVTNLGNSAYIECWSGDTKIYQGISTGKVKSEASSDGYFFKDRADGKLKEVSGNCVITYQ